MYRTDVTINQETIVSQVEVIMTQEASKSNKMKQLFDLGLDVKEIAQIMDVRYNFVYNVVSNYVNVDDIPVSHTQAESKKDQIIEMFEEGKSNKEIAKALKLNYNYIYKVVREYGEQQANSFRQKAVANETPAPVPTAAATTVAVQPQQVIQIPVSEKLPELIQNVIPELAPDTPAEPVEQPAAVSSSPAGHDWRAAISRPRR
jgi:transposase